MPAAVRAGTMPETVPGAVGPAIVHGGGQVAESGAGPAGGTVRAIVLGHAIKLGPGRAGTAPETVLGAAAGPAIVHGGQVIVGELADGRGGQETVPGPARPRPGQPGHARASQATPGPAASARPTSRTAALAPGAAEIEHRQEVARDKRARGPLLRRPR